MAAVLFVRVKSEVEPAELERRLFERLPRFKAVPGLMQKVYGRDDATGDVCGIYFFERAEALAAFRSSELAKSIASAYEAVDVQRETYSVLTSLWPDRGPFTDEPSSSSGNQPSPRASGRALT
jgi:hypothetical protein